ncbi:MAG TPA: hypothetical protein VMK83_03715 [Gaiellaceae bacterium]|nr:hypothetical protein [Gaiellaceae bacterium]
MGAKEFEHGRELLRRKIETSQPQLVVFTFKKTAEVLFGKFAGSGRIPGLKLGGRPVFVMPGPCAPGADVDARLRELEALADELATGRS